MSNSILNNAESADKVEENDDFLPSSDFASWESDIYGVKIKYAYLGESKKKAKNLTVCLVNSEGKEKSITFYYTSNETKNCRTYFVDKKDKTKKRDLPGYALFKEMASTIANKSIEELKTESKTLELWNYEHSKNMLTEVDVISDFTNQKAKLAITKVISNKYANGANTNDKRESNEIIKALYSDGSTVKEKADGSNAVWSDKWLDMNKGKDTDKFKPVEDASNSSDEEDDEW